MNPVDWTPRAQFSCKSLREWKCGSFSATLSLVFEGVLGKMSDSSPGGESPQLAGDTVEASVLPEASTVAETVPSGAGLSSEGGAVSSISAAGGDDVDQASNLVFQGENGLSVYREGSPVPPEHEVVSVSSSEEKMVLPTSANVPGQTGAEGFPQAISLIPAPGVPIPGAGNVKAESSDDLGPVDPDQLSRMAYELKRDEFFHLYGEGSVLEGIMMSDAGGLPRSHDQRTFQINRQSLVTLAGEDPARRAELSVRWQEVLQGVADRNPTWRGLQGFPEEWKMGSKYLDPDTAQGQKFAPFPSFPRVDSQDEALVTVAPVTTSQVVPVSLFSTTATSQVETVSTVASTVASTAAGSQVGPGPVLSTGHASWEEEVQASETLVCDQEEDMELGDTQMTPHMQLRCQQVLIPSGMSEDDVKQTMQMYHIMRKVVQVGPVNFRKSRNIKKYDWVKKLPQGDKLKKCSSFWAATEVPVNEAALLAVCLKVHPLRDKAKGKKFPKMAYSDKVGMHAKVAKKHLEVEGQERKEGGHGTSSILLACRSESALPVLWESPETFMAWIREFTREFPIVDLPFQDSEPGSANPVMRVPCPYQACRDMLDIREPLVNHLIKEHLGKDPVKCTNCARLFPQDKTGYFAYADHLRLFHREAEDELDGEAYNRWPFGSNDPRGKKPAIPRASQEDVVTFAREMTLRILLKCLYIAPPVTFREACIKHFNDLCREEKDHLSRSSMVPVTTTTTENLTTDDEGDSSEGERADPSFIPVTPGNAKSHRDDAPPRRSERGTTKASTTASRGSSSHRGRRERGSRSSHRSPSLDRSSGHKRGGHSSQRARSHSQRDNRHSGRSSQKRDHRASDGSVSQAGGSSARSDSGGSARKKRRVSSKSTRSPERGRDSHQTSQSRQAGKKGETLPRVPTPGSRPSVLERAETGSEISDTEVVAKVIQYGERTKVKTFSNKEYLVPRAVGVFGTTFTVPIVPGEDVYFKPPSDPTGRGTPGVPVRGLLARRGWRTVSASALQEPRNPTPRDSAPKGGVDTLVTTATSVKSAGDSANVALATASQEERRVERETSRPQGVVVGDVQLPTTAREPTVKKQPAWRDSSSVVEQERQVPREGVERDLESFLPIPSPIPFPLQPLDLQTIRSYEDGWRRAGAALERRLSQMSTSLAAAVSVTHIPAGSVVIMPHEGRDRYRSARVVQDMRGLLCGPLPPEETEQFVCEVVDEFSRTVARALEAESELSRPLSRHRSRGLQRQEGYQPSAAPVSYPGFDFNQSRIATGMMAPAMSAVSAYGQEMGMRSYAQPQPPPTSTIPAAQGMAPSPQSSRQIHVPYAGGDHQMVEVDDTPPRPGLPVFQPAVVTGSPLTAGIASMSLGSQASLVEIPAQQPTGPTPTDGDVLHQLFRRYLETPAGQHALEQVRGQGQQAASAVCPSQRRDEGRDPDLR